jgi:hypothetical protein
MGYDESGEYFEASPAPADVKISGMNAGENPVMVTYDC